MATTILRIQTCKSKLTKRGYNEWAFVPDGEPTLRKKAIIIIVDLCFVFP